MAKKTVFNNQWLDAQLNPDFVSWLSDVNGSANQAYCKVCHKRFELSNMGVRAVLSHSNGPTHKKNLEIKWKQPNIATFLINQQTSDKSNPSTSGDCSLPVLDKPSSSGPKQLINYVLKDDVQRAEVLWALKVVTSKMSFNSCSNIGELFQLMFPDSSIAKQFTLGSTKVAYTISYGLAPYFRDLLLHRLERCDAFVICFDESLNKVVQRGQMDLVVRFWDISQNKVATRYLNSVFLGKATADDLLDKFCEGISPLPLSKLLQTSMDGPNVNLSFHKKLDQLFEDEHENTKLLDLGTCGLHTVHGALKTGFKAAGLDIQQVLCHMYYIFKDSPARRATYTAVTGCEIFPLKFCSVRWVENVACAERALKVYDSVKKYIEQAKLSTSEASAGMRMAVADPLMKCKLAFFKTIASECEPFLRRFQSSKPLAPFLYEGIQQLLITLLHRCIKKPKIDAASLSIPKLFAIDLKSVDNLLERDKVEIGFATTKLLKAVKVSDREKGEFLLQCRNVLTAMISKLKDRSPMKYKVVRSLSCLDPNLIIQQTALAKHRMKDLLQVLHESNRITDNVAEKANVQYTSLCKEAKVKFEVNFNDYESRKKTEEIGLDVFYGAIMTDKPEYETLWNVTKLCLILSHGNASVESGFSINKSLLIENMKEESVVCQRHVYDSILELGGIDSVIIDKKMLQSVGFARKNYQQHLDTKQQLLREENKMKSEKRKLNDEIKQLDEEKKRIRKEAQLGEIALDLKIKQLQNKKTSM